MGCRWGWFPCPFCTCEMAFWGHLFWWSGGMGSGGGSCGFSGVSWWSGVMFWWVWCEVSVSSVWFCGVLWWFGGQGRGSGVWGLGFGVWQCVPNWGPSPSRIGGPGASRIWGQNGGSSASRMSYLLRTCPGAWGVYTVCTRVHTRPGVPNWRPELGPQCVPNLGSRFWGLGSGSWGSVSESENFCGGVENFFFFLVLLVGMHVERMMFLVG